MIISVKRINYLLKKVVVKMPELPWKTFHSYETKPEDLITPSANLYENLKNETISQGKMSCAF
jgi:hypothetical protein